jgi:hypothetical protein
MNVAKVASRALVACSLSNFQARPSSERDDASRNLAGHIKHSPHTIPTAQRTPTQPPETTMASSQKPQAASEPRNGSRVPDQDQMSLLSLLGGSGSFSNPLVIHPEPARPQQQSLLSILEEALLILEDFPSERLDGIQPVDTEAFLARRQ